MAISLLAISILVLANPSYSFESLKIDEAKWNELANSKEKGDLALNSLKFNDHELIIDEKNNKVYYSIIKSSSNKYSPTIRYKANSGNIKLAFLSDEITDDKIMTNHEFKLMLYNDTQYREYSMFCTSMPMLNLVFDEEMLNNRIPIAMEMFLFNNMDSSVNRIVMSNGSIKLVDKIEGETNYSFSMSKLSPNNNERENVMSLLNMRPSNEYYLNVINSGENINNDTPNLMKLVPKDFRPSGDIKEKPLKDKKNRTEQQGESGDKLGEFGEGRIERPVEVFVNNEYKGLYALSYNEKDIIRNRKR